MANPRSKVAQSTPVLGLPLAEGLTEKEWLNLGYDLGHEARLSAFKIGDWLVYADKSFGVEGLGNRNRYEQAEEVTGFGYTTLRNYASVCRSVDLSRRRDTLTFGHHQAVASLDDEAQERILSEAATDRWTVAKIRDEVQKAKADEVVTLSLPDMPRRVAESWKAEAKDAGQPIWLWLFEQIECARQQLEQAAVLTEVAA